ncbi:hypothetical protein ABB37_07156 [Leptomonas pyrrhocoris]|uniref:Secreted peptide n=1 Tax=Leptomonas pyrrhocoris TaxID=157538 RepID=A0A0M9FW95_LEPPY|nr:hypothetical protein ABB37_07156 [Leptomonas pyrrhocoris]KPA77259.1 hypothetical protein ABB37_07156 [Leptomonas pyrrhocoris]|eukprot:XP_015655698.1 hypothetical protein ABB37_07156 [Leptomonas pyrrhocoris]
MFVSPLLSVFFFGSVLSLLLLGSNACEFCFGFPCCRVPAFPPPPLLSSSLFLFLKFSRFQLCDLFSLILLFAVF